MKINKKVKGFLLLGIGIIYLLNFGFGFVEFLPDNLPWIGNIDEGIAGALTFTGLKMMGFFK
jgi:hypothetical protein